MGATINLVDKTFLCKLRTAVNPPKIETKAGRQKLRGMMWLFAMHEVHLFCAA